MLAAKLLSGMGGKETPYVDDVFSAYTYTGNGSIQTINNGIDLAGKGGMVWIKDRTNPNPHFLVDTVKGRSRVLVPGTTYSETSSGSPNAVGNDITAFTATGFDLGNTYNNTNYSLMKYASWTFRNAPKFFDVVTYTGNGTAQTIAHSLGVQAGMVIIKRTDTTSNWAVWHTKLGTGPTYGDDNVLFLNTTAAKTVSAAHFGGTINSNTFYISSHADINASGGTYVAYIFAHDTSTDGLIQCGSFTTDGSGNATVNLGWEPQYLMVKTTGLAQNWFVVDTTRGMSHGSHSTLSPNTSAAEALALNNGYVPTATGFKINGALSSSQPYIYLAIRRPNKPPTVGTQVYNAIARTGTGAAATVTGVGFAPDLLMCAQRTRAFGTETAVYDRLRGININLDTHTTGAEVSYSTSVGSYDMAGVTLGTQGIVNQNAYTYINWFFKRAVGVHDQVCYTGTGVAKTEAHNLGVAPELMIVKARSSASLWSTYHVANGANYSLDLSQSAAKYLVGANDWNNTTPTASVFSLGSGGVTNTNAVTFVAYLFATKAGISKVGSYTGNGGTQTINCGFTTGARFVLIKRTDSTGDWYVWDTVRGIIAGNDPHLSLNTTVSEVTTDDSIDSDTTGFIVNQNTSTYVNATSATYIFLALA